MGPARSPARDAGAAPRVKKSRTMKGAALPAEQALARQMWLADSLTSLRSLLAAPGPFRDAFRAFLAADRADAELDFYVGVLAMRALDDAGDADDKADELHELYLADVGDGIGQQQRTKATQRLWATARKKGNAASGKEIRRAVEKEAERTLQSLAFDAFPRFLKTDLCSKAMKAMKKSGGKSATDAALADNLEKIVVPRERVQRSRSTSASSTCAPWTTSRGGRARGPRVPRAGAVGAAAGGGRGAPAVDERSGP